MAAQQLDSIVEAVLLSSDEVLTADRIAASLERQDATPAAVGECVERLNEHYNSSGRAFEIVEQAGGFRIMTRPEYGNYVRRVLKTRSRERLSQAALETLAVVAYRQPVPRSQIENIRGVDSGAMLRMLIDKGLVKIVGREESLGHPLLYGTTRFFLEMFGLKDLKSLPNAQELISRDDSEGSSPGRKSAGSPSEAEGEEATDEAPPTQAVVEAIAAMAEAQASQNDEGQGAGLQIAAEDDEATEEAEADDEAAEEAGVDAEAEAEDEPEK